MKYVFVNLPLSYTRLFLFGSLLMLPIVCTEAKEITLKFNDSAVVNDSIIMLSDIANIHENDLSSIRVLKTVVIGKSAPPGYSRLVTVQDLIRYSLQPLIPEVKIVPIGNKRISVRTGSITCKVSQMQEKITAYLDSAISWKKGNWSAEIKNGEQEWFGYDHPFTCSVTGLNSGYTKGKVFLSLLFLQGSKIKKIPVECVLTVSAPVLVARRDIDRTTTLSSDDYEIRTIDITQFGPDPFTDPQELIDVMAMMTIKAGTIIQKRMIKKVPDVIRGESIVVVYSKGRVSCTIQGTARESGVTGDKIWVENSMTRSLLRVVIIGKGRVALV